MAKVDLTTDTHKHTHTFDQAEWMNPARHQRPGICPERPPACQQYSVCVMILEKACVVYLHVYTVVRVCKGPCRRRVVPPTHVANHWCVYLQVCCDQWKNILNVLLTFNLS